MTNDLARVTKLAEEYGAYVSRDNGKIIFDESEELLAFEQAVLAKREEEHAESIDFCESVMDDQLNKIESLQAKLAMQAETLKWIGRQDSMMHFIAMREKALETLYQADVDNWMQAKKAEWEKGALEEAAIMVDLLRDSFEASSEIRKMANRRGGCEMSDSKIYADISALKVFERNAELEQENAELKRQNNICFASLANAERIIAERQKQEFDLTQGRYEWLLANYKPD